MTDAQLLPYLSPRLNDTAAALFGEDYDEGSGALKLAASGGDIDVIVAPLLTRPDIADADVLGRAISAQTPEEILAKKIQYRGYAFTHRDAFDLAMLLSRDPSRVAAACADCGEMAIKRLRQRLALLLPVLTAELPDTVNATELGQPLIAEAADRIAAWLSA